MKAKTAILMSTIGAVVWFVPLVAKEIFCETTTVVATSCASIDALASVTIFVGLLLLLFFLIFPLMFTLVGFPVLRSLLKSEGKWTMQAESQLKTNFFVISELLSK
jgi:hypothetical protein